MKRHLVTILGALSLLVCVAAAVEWIRNGGIWIPWHWSNGPFVIKFSNYRGFDDDWGSGSFVGFRLVEHLGETGEERWLVVPSWLVIILSAPLPIWWTLTRRRGTIEE